MAVKSLSPLKVSSLKEDAQEWAMNCGLLLQGAPAPLALLPSPFPAPLFQRHFLTSSTSP